jgi:hypothetical protein
VIRLVTDLSMPPRLLRTPVLIALLLGLVLLTPSPAARATAADVPSSLSDQAFWQLVTGASEAGGTFASNNWVSNEVAYQTVLPDLTRRVPRGGVYLGVGPDQNFTYIVAVRPKIAFIVDIRRQNMLQHLLYKAVIELSPTRAEFASRLFSRARPAGIGPNATADALLSAVGQQAPDEQLYRSTLAQAIDLLKHKHGFGLRPDDERTIEYVLQTFLEYGPDLTYSPMAARVLAFGTIRMTGTSIYPTFADLMSETDGQGTHRAYLASEDHYRVLREMQQKNLIVPLVGDFAGDKALRAVGRWVREHGAKVTTFYTSNVEQYLFQNNVWREYYENVAALPLDQSSTFIRSYFPTQFLARVAIGNQAFRPAPELPASTRSMPLPSATLLCSIGELLAAVKTGRIDHYFDVIDLSMGK